MLLLQFDNGAIVWVCLDGLVSLGVVCGCLGVCEH